MIAVKQETALMGILKVLMIALFVVILFFSFVVPALKDTYGYSFLASNQGTSGIWNY